MWDALYMSREVILSEEISDEITAFASLTYSVIGTRPGMIFRQDIEELYRACVGPLKPPVLCQPRDDREMRGMLHASQLYDAQQKMVSLTYLLVADKLCPYQFEVPHTRIRGEAILDFLDKQERLGQGHVAYFYNYLEGTRLYFSDYTEAMMARLVFTTANP